MLKSNVKFLFFVMVFVLITVLTACGGQTSKEGTNSTVSSEQKDITSEVTGETIYPFEIKDITETAVILEEEPKRVVTLVPSDTEIVFAINGQEKLVGVNAYSDYPAEAANIASIGDMTINIEAVVALEPDLVLASQLMNGDYITTLRDLGLTVYVGEPTTYEQTISHIEALGQLLNNQEEANSVAAHMREVKQDIETKVANVEKPKVYLEFSPGWTIGKDTFINDLIQIAGGDNISQAQSGWFEVNGEAVVEANPAVIIYPNFGEPESSILKGINERAGWQVIEAIKQDRVVEVSNEPLVRVGPRLTLGLQELAKAIHPELFN